mmetsp:Transcript_18060/g.27361  ORF Transcript_18060/g.27361 Transcript_18060/m.27361 type:complete len:89 (+) Transcript_18060:2544-2810(+)
MLRLQMLTFHEANTTSTYCDILCSMVEKERILIQGTKLETEACSTLSSLKAGLGCSLRPRPRTSRIEDITVDDNLRLVAFSFKFCKEK